MTTINNNLKFESEALTEFITKLAAVPQATAFITAFRKDYEAELKRNDDMAKATAWAEYVEKVRKSVEALQTVECKTILTGDIIYNKLTDGSTIKKTGLIQFYHGVMYFGFWNIDCTDPKAEDVVAFTGIKFNDYIKYKEGVPVVNRFGIINSLLGNELKGIAPKPDIELTYSQLRRAMGEDSLPKSVAKALKVCGSLDAEFGKISGLKKDKSAHRLGDLWYESKNPNSSQLIRHIAKACVDNLKVLKQSATGKKLERLNKLLEELGYVDNTIEATTGESYEYANSDQAANNYCGKTVEVSDTEYIKRYANTEAKEA